MPLWYINDRISIIRSINDNQLLEKVKRHCFNIISKNENNNNYDNLRNILQNYLKEQILNSNLWVNIGNKQINDFGNINPNSVMIFQYSNSSKNLYIHVAKLSN